MKIWQKTLLTFFLGACASFQGPNEQEAEEADAYAKIAHSHFREKRFPESLSSIEQALKLDPNNSSYIMTKGLIYFKMDRLVDASQWVSRACQSSQAPECWNNLAAIKNAEKKYSEALVAVDKALAVPTYSTPEYAVVNKSVALLGLKKNYQAKTLLKKALSTWPKDCGLRLHLVRAQIRDRAYEDAGELNNFTLKICPQSALPTLWDAYLLYKIGNVSKARYSLEKVLRFFPKTSHEEWARSALEKLEQKVPLEEPSVDIEDKGV